jgi:hypothetical protein
MADEKDDNTGGGTASEGTARRTTKAPAMPAPEPQP